MDGGVTLMAVRELPGTCFGGAQWVRLPGLPEGDGPRGAEIIRFHGDLGRLALAGEFELGICVYRRRPLRVDQMERHAETQELLYAIDDDFLMPVALSAPGSAMPDVSGMAALLVKRGEGIIFEKGVWHWVPYPLNGDSFALVGFARGTATADMTTCMLETPVEMAAS